MHQWVASHPSGTPIVVHYDPANPNSPVLTATDMPYAGPRTPNNLKLLLIAAGASVVPLMAAKRLARNRTTTK